MAHSMEHSTAPKMFSTEGPVVVHRALGTWSCCWSLNAPCLQDALRHAQSVSRMPHSDHVTVQVDGRTVYEWMFVQDKSSHGKKTMPHACPGCKVQLALSLV